MLFMIKLHVITACILKSSTRHVFMKKIQINTNLGKREYSKMNIFNAKQIKTVLIR